MIGAGSAVGLLLQATIRSKKANNFYVLGGRKAAWGTKFADVVFNGSMSGFQPEGAGSNPAVRSKYQGLIPLTK